jgi:hypothetical protein
MRQVLEDRDACVKFSRPPIFAESDTSLDNATRTVSAALQQPSASSAAISGSELSRLRLYKSPPHTFSVRLLRLAEVG